MRNLERLKKLVKTPIEIKIKENRSSYISCRKVANGFLLFLHKDFLSAEIEVIEAVSDFIKGKKGKMPIIKEFIYRNENDKIYSLDEKKLCFKGKVYDLKEIFRVLNEKYFDKKLDLYITWAKKPRYKKFRHITFGSYIKNLKLIKINKILDDEKIPKYFIDFIVYHEMLHYIYPVKMEDGKRKIHGEDFKKAEKKFFLYKKAKKFGKEFIGDGYGRT